MQNRSLHKPIKVNQDKDAKYLASEEARYMLNNERSIAGGGKSKTGKSTPMPANELICSIEVDDSDSGKKPFPIGSYRSELTNEVYTFYYNEGGNNFITRTNDDKTCEIVYEGECLQLSPLPEHAITQFRAYLKYDRFCAYQGGKQLIWTDGIHPIGMLDVEASIATNSFTTQFFKNCYGCEALQLCVPEPCGALEGDYLQRSEEDAGLSNKIIDAGFQIMYRHVYYDQRASEWSDISTLYFQDSQGGCFDSEEGLSRCMQFRVPVGNPLVDKIQIAYRVNNTANWYLSDTIEKYQPYTNSEQQWYERELADLEGYSDEDCSFDYIFCNDKQCDPIDPEETNRVFNPIPREAQGLLRIKDSLAFYNYKKGTCPLSEAETKKFEISINDSDDRCTQEFSTVTFYAIVHQTVQEVNQPIFRFGGGKIDSDDDTDDTAYFGGIMQNYLFRGGVTERDGYQQYFVDETRNFIGYVEGTNYWCNMEQWVSDSGFVNTEKIGVIGGFSEIVNYAKFESQRNNGKFYFQKGVIRVPKGTRGFIRLVNHKEETGVGDAQDTSTFVSGTIPTLLSYHGTKKISDIIVKNDYELYFDTCDGDVEIEKTFVIRDRNIENVGGSHSSSAYSGYITDEEGSPVEGAEVWYDRSSYAIADHNGFYHFYIRDGQDTTLNVSVRVEQSSSGAFVEVQTEDLSSAFGATEKDILIEQEGYTVNYYEDISVLVKDCDDEPIGGVIVAMSGSKYSISDSVTGIARFRIRNYSTRDRQVRAVVMNDSGCFNVDCDGNCNFCLPQSDLVAMPESFEGVNYTNIALNDNLNKNYAQLNNYGLKAGGRYEWAMIAKGSCGNISAAYPITIMNGSVPSEDGYMNVPKTQEKNSLSFSNFTYDGSNVDFPEWADCLIIARTKNQNPYELQWVVDKVERIENNKIRLTIQSLNDYNAKFNFRSNTIYQYTEGDRVEFISNGDGSIFDINTYGLLNYKILSPFHDEVISGEDAPPANFFNQLIIENDRSLPEIIEGAKIELQRDKDCTEENQAFFAVLTLPLIEVSGRKVLAEPTGVFQTFDTYLVSRSIDSNLIQFFEHKNPSDFWGDAINGISDIGKAYFKNRFENEMRYGRNITINNQNQYNRFGDFEKTLDAPEQGDLTAMYIYDGKIGLGIGQFDSFLFQVSDDFLRVSNDGIIRAATANEIISDTEPKISGRYGCQYPHIGSIYFGDGYVTWADVAKSAYIKHDFSSAKDIAQGQMNSYFAKKFNYMEYQNSISNKLGQFRFITGFNEHTDALMLTMRRLNGAHISNAKTELESESETLLIDPIAEEFLTWVSFCPQSYSLITLKDGSGCAFVAYVDGETYIHPVISNVYNRFFGQAVDRVITFSCNQEQDIIKRFIALEIQDETMWFVSKVLVDNPNFESEIPPIKFKKEENKWNGSFLSNKNGIGGIYASNGAVSTKPLGYYALITIVRDNTDNLKYGTIDNSKREKFDELDMVLVKYFHSESSGMKSNL